MVSHTGGAKLAVRGSIVEITPLEKGLGLLRVHSASILTPVESMAQRVITTGVIRTQIRTGTTAVLLVRHVTAIIVTLETVRLEVHTVQVHVSCDSVMEQVDIDSSAVHCTLLKQTS